MAKNEKPKQSRQEILDGKVKRLKRQGYTGARPLANDKQEMFCQEYLVDLNVHRAGLRAGYDDAPYRLMQDPKVVIRIEYLKAERQRKLNVEQMMVVDELKRLAFSNILEFVDVDEKSLKFKQGMNDPTHPLFKNGGVIQELTVQDGKTRRIGIKLHDKIQALDKLMRHMDMFEKARLAIEQEKLELLKLKNAPEEAMEVGDDGFIEAMGMVAEEGFDDVDIRTEDYDDSDDE